MVGQFRPGDSDQRILQKHANSSLLNPPSTWLMGSKKASKFRNDKKKKIFFFVTLLSLFKTRF